MLGIYCRTSKNREEKHTIENQRESGIACAKKFGLGFRVYIDDGISGTLDESVRDGLSDLIRDIRKKEITHVYCINQSRIERDTRTWDFFVAECINNKIIYMPGASVFDLDNPTNRMFAQLMSIVNAYYAEISSKTARMANARKAREGKTHGLKAYGYMRNEKNEYVIDEVEAVHVKRMFELSLQGLGTYSIANILNEERVPTKFSGNFKGEIKRKNKFTKSVTEFKKSKVRWRGNVIYDILKNKIYKGIREWNRYEDTVDYVAGRLVKSKVIAERIVYDKIPQIIEPSLWNKVNENLERNKKKVGKKAEYKYLLNGLIFCEDCKREFVGKKRLASGDNAYKCKGKIYPHPDCKTSRGISINKLDSFIIKHLFKNRDFQRQLLSIPKNDKEYAGITMRLTNEKKKLLDYERRLRTAQNRLLIPELENDEFLVQSVIELKSSVTKQKQLIENLEQNAILIEHENRIKRTRNAISKYFDGINFEDLKVLVHSLIDFIKIKHQKRKGTTGFFIVQIKYRGYSDISNFITDWKASNWYLLSSSFTKKKKNPNTIYSDRREAMLEYDGYYDFDVKISEKTWNEFLDTPKDYSEVVLDKKDIFYFD